MSFKEKVRLEGLMLKQCEVDKVEHIAESTSFEVGLFAQVLTVLCLEQGIDVSIVHVQSKELINGKTRPVV